MRLPPIGRAVRFALLALVVAATCGCDWNRLMVRQVNQVIRRQTAAFERFTDVDEARESGGAMLVGLDALLRSAPQELDFLVAGAKLNTMYGFSLIEDLDPARACVYYEKARLYGLRALTRVAGFTEALARGGAALDAVLARCGKKELEPLFWTAYAWGLRINLRRQDAKGLAELPTAEQMMRRVLALDPGFHYAAPHIFFGVLYGMRSAALGGDLAASRRHFETALALNRGRYLLTRVLFARFYAVQAQDRAVFLRELERVRAAPASLCREQALANTVAVRRATRLLGQVDDLILPDVPEDGPLPIPAPGPPRERRGLFPALLGRR
ncbi:MAG: hypothetical protein HZA54_08395 [Planctomycetes bacterium]|nr:hypothetical protein [Planctomycetota bacterium]